MRWLPLRSKDHEKAAVVAAFLREIPCDKVTQVQKSSAVPCTEFRAHCLTYKGSASGKYRSLGFYTFNMVNGTVRKEATHA